jgi:hypothetical protein
MKRGGGEGKGREGKGKGRRTIHVHIKCDCVLTRTGASIAKIHDDSSRVIYLRLFVNADELGNDNRAGDRPV